MALKSYERFLDFTSMGAVGTKKIRDYLESQGHKIIGLDRSSQSNKIWTTKIKQLRAPDLLCLKCGQRIECRAKSKLQITMSDTPTRPDRHWDYGLRDGDLVGFVLCEMDPQSPYGWVASDKINLFSVENLRNAVGKSRLGKPKGASEGAEQDRNWPAWVPGYDGKVVSVDDKTVTLVKDNGRRYSYSLKDRDYHPHVRTGDIISKGALIAASVVKSTETGRCLANSYDFASDLHSNDRETVNAACKALGFASGSSARIISDLEKVSHSHPDRLIALQAAASLARLGNEYGWRLLEQTATSGQNLEIRMECVLILGELLLPRAIDILYYVASQKSNPGELRAAAIWGLGQYGNGAFDMLLSFVGDPDTDVALHAIVAASRTIDNSNVNQALDMLGLDHRTSAAIVQLVLSSESNSGAKVVHKLMESKGLQRGWLMYLAGLMGKDSVIEHLDPLLPRTEPVIRELSLMWEFHCDNWTNSVDMQSDLSLLKRQF